MFHCLSGKDRTGVVAALLLLALGVDRDVVLDDYELTSTYRAAAHVPGVVDLLVEAGIARPAAIGILGSPRWAMAEALDAVDGKHGGIDRWLTRSAGVGPEVVAALRQRLTNDC